MDGSKDNYYRERLVRLNLSGETIWSRTFEECDFDGCTFIDCTFDKCKFLNCKFNDCSLTAVVPVNCQLVETEFFRCKVQGIDWTKTQRITEPHFFECRIDFSNFRLLKLPKTKMVKCEVKESDFIETDLSAGDFKNTDFEKSIFFKTNLTEADFRGASNYAIDVKTNVLKKTRFSLPEALSLLDSLDIIIE